MQTDTLQKKEHGRCKSWLTQEILEMIEQRRKYRKWNSDKYREIHNLMRNKIREAKNTWMEETCN